MEKIEWYQYDEALPEWEAKMHIVAEELRAEYIKKKQSFLYEAKKYFPNYSFKWHLIREERHRRLIPFLDKAVEDRIEELT